MRASVFWLVVSLMMVSGALAQSEVPLVISRLDGPIVLDGLSDEPAWLPVTPLHLVQYEPNAGAPPTERTEVLVGYDDEYIYFALRGYDRDRNGIRANTLYRDRLSGDDHFEVLLDTFNDNETAVLFTTTPAGIRKDAAISNDASGGTISSGGWINGDFNTFWDVETVVSEEGWFAEMRVPFSSLRFQDDDGMVTMGFAVQRKVARKTERLVFPHVPPVADWAFLKPSLAQKIVLEGIYPRKPLYVTPYGLSGVEQAYSAQSTEPSIVRHDDTLVEVGGDLKYGLTNNLTLDLTVNTDFAQVEADDQQVNLTRFSLFFPEKRQFFQERASIFDFRTGGVSRLFHSRRIGLTDDGEVVRLLGGARLVGRTGEWDVGFMNMQTAQLDSIPSENFSVLRTRRQVLNAYSYAGAMATSRIGRDGTYNIAYGLDALLRLVGDDYLTLKWTQSFDSERSELNLLNGFNSGRFIVEMQRRRRRGVGYTSGIIWSGAHYDPGIGFTQRTDFLQLNQALSYSWLPGEASPLIWHTLGIDGFAFLRNADHSFESVALGPTWDVALKSGEGGAIEAKLLYEDLRTPFVLAKDAEVPVGSYSFYRVGASYHMSHTRLVQLRGSINGGTFYDGWQLTLLLAPIWYVSRHLELRGDYVYNRVRFPDRNQRFDAHIVRLRIGTALNTKLSTNALIQYNSAQASLSANVRFRYNFREGNDLWIVYNEGVNTELDQGPGEPNLPRTDTRTVLLKYTYTFQL